MRLAVRIIVMAVLISFTVGTSFFGFLAKSSLAETPSLPSEASVVKNVLVIVARQTKYDSAKGILSCTGDALAMIGGQNASLKAYSITFDQNTKIIDARGNVQIVRKGMVTTGTAFRFRAISNDYLVTEPHVAIDEIYAYSRHGTDSIAGSAPLVISVGITSESQQVVAAEQNVSDKISYAQGKYIVTRRNYDAEVRSIGPFTITCKFRTKPTPNSGRNRHPIPEQTGTVAKSMFACRSDMQ